jgi:hypothetical protein
MLYRIKPLEWKKVGNGCWTSKTPCGSIEINGGRKSGYWIAGQDWVAGGGEKHDSLVTCKMIAQRDFERRLMEAIEPADYDDCLQVVDAGKIPY